MKGQRATTMPLALAIVLLLVAICLGAAGQILIKAGLRALGEEPSAATVVMSLFRSIYVAGGFGCYAFSSILYLLALSKLALSYAYPMVALSYVVVTILAWRLLDERVSALRVVGLVVIMVGVVIMALSYKSESPPGNAEPPAAVHAELPE
jgi:drug/metabolite transporter (DMT)-like permease